MPSIYGNAFVTVAASGAEDGTQGFFFERTHTWRCLALAKLGDNQQILYSCFDSQRIKSLSKSPLESRAWVLQEADCSTHNTFYQ
jgi:hypothetical protein